MLVPWKSGGTGLLREVAAWSTWRGVVDCSHAGWVDGDRILRGRTVEQVLIFCGAGGKPEGEGGNFLFYFIEKEEWARKKGLAEKGGWGGMDKTITLGVRWSEEDTFMKGVLELRERLLQRKGKLHEEAMSWRGDSTGMVSVSWISLLPYRFVYDLWGLISFCLFILMFEYEHWGFLLCYCGIWVCLPPFYVWFLAWFLTDFFGLCSWYFCFGSSLGLDWDTFSTYPNT